MSKINQIQLAILSLDPGAYQALMDSYLFVKYGFSNILPYGSHSGTNKTTKGTPDSFVRCNDGRFILIAYGTVEKHAFKKIESDILNCLDSKKTGIETEDIARIICCHTSTNLSPGDVKQLCSHFSDTVLIGLGDVSYDLCYHYPELAKSFLGISVNTNQIFKVQDFISYEARNPYGASLDMPLLCREQEKKEIVELLDREHVVLISGPSGVGKTRLTLEAAKEYAHDKGNELRVIRSNGEPILDDIRAAFPDDNNYIAFVDDANQLAYLNHFLDICADLNRHHSFKIVMTVRDYAKEKLLRTVRSVIAPALYEVNALTSQDIGRILAEDLDIKNTDLQKHIQDIAKGNIRIAIMAGISAKKGRFDLIRNSIELFDDYFSEIIEHLEKDVVLGAAIIALFDSFLLNESGKPFEIAARNGIGAARFTDICMVLHEQEIVNVFENKAVKFENQNIRDYLLYYAFFKERLILPSDIIVSAFPQYRERIVFAFNTLIKLFYTEENATYIEMEIRSAWSKIKGGSDRISLEFIEAFHAVIPEESLVYLKQRIQKMPEQHTNLLAFDFEKNENNHGIHSDLAKILAGFKDTNNFEDAIQLALYYFERTTEYPEDIYTLFGEKWGIDQRSCRNDYQKERTLLCKLNNYYKVNGSVLSAFCLLFAAAYVLRLEYEAVELNEGRTITFYHFGIKSGEGIYELRSLAIESLFLLFQDERFRELAQKCILKYPRFPQLHDDKDIMAHDILVIADCFSDIADINDFATCKLLHCFENICQKQGIPWPEKLPKSTNNSVFRLFLGLSENDFFNEEWEKAQATREKAILDIAMESTESDIASLWSTLEGDVCTKADDVWSIQTGIDMFFSALAHNDPSKFLQCCDLYISCQVPYDENNNGIIDGLIRILGYKGAISYIDSKDFRKKDCWLNAVFDRIPEECVNEALCKRIIKNIVAKDNIASMISLRTALRINVQVPGFLVKYISELNEVCQKRPNMISWFLLPVGHEKLVSVKEIVSAFGDKIEVLCSAYIYAVRGGHYYDNHGQLFIELVHQNPGFLKRLIRETYKDNIDRLASCLMSLWAQENYSELISFVVDEIQTMENKTVLWNPLLEKLLSGGREGSLANLRRNEWIANYIRKNAQNIEAIKFLFIALCNLSEDILLFSVTSFCKCNSSYDDFCKISITPMHMSWSGSEIPVIERRISYLEKLNGALEGFNFIEHRARISELIHGYKKREESVQLEEFLENG